MPWRPASHASRAAAPARRPAAARSGLRRVLVIGLLIFLLAALSWVFVPLIWRYLVGSTDDPPIGDAMGEPRRVRKDLLR